MTKERVLVALVENKSGVLEDVASLFRRRGFNLTSVTVGPCETPGLSRMTVVVESSVVGGQNVDQARKQVEKLVRVVEVFDVTEEAAASQEMILIKIEALSDVHQDRVLRLVDNFHAKIIATEQNLFIIGLMGTKEEIANLVRSIRDFHLQIREMAPSGLVTLKM